MLSKLDILKSKIKSLKLLLHVLLRFKQPTDSIVVLCSQHLDEYIVKYQKINYSKHKSKNKNKKIA